MFAHGQGQCGGPHRRRPGRPRSASGIGWLSRPPVQISALFHVAQQLPPRLQRCPARLLHHVRQFVRRQRELRRTVPCPKINVPPVRERLRPHRLAHPLRVPARVHPHVAKIHPKPRLHVPPHRLRQRPPPPLAQPHLPLGVLPRLETPPLRPARLPRQYPFLLLLLCTPRRPYPRNPLP